MSKQFVSKIALPFLIILFSIQCRKNDIKNPGGNVNDTKTTTASVQGFILSESGSPLSNASVTCGTYTTTTNAKGFFRFNSITLSKNNGYVKVTKQGYFNGSRSFVTNTGRTNNVIIRMLSKNSAGTINATTGGTINLTNGASVRLPATGVVNKTTNAAYTGTVNVFISWIDPSGTSYPETMPGDFRGITTNNEERGLQTFGMLAVELTGSSGEMLQIAPGKKATLTFPLPASISSSAPSSIPLWYFDEEKGRWMEEGSATKSGNTYTGEVSHFSFWNCDGPLQLIDFSATILTPANQPLPFLKVTVNRLTGGPGSGSGYTDSTGYISGQIPANEPLILGVYNSCNALVYTQNIGPFSSSANIGNVIVSGIGNNIVTVSGTLLNCNGQPVTNGYVLLDAVENTYPNVINVSNGNFTGTFITCNTTTAFTVTGYDHITGQQNIPQTFTITAPVTNIGAIRACGTVVDEYINVLVDSTLHTVTKPGSPRDTLDQTHFVNQPGVNGPHPYTDRIEGMKLVRAVGDVFESYVCDFSSPKSTGVFPMTGWYVTAVGTGSILSGGQVTITRYDAIGGYIEGYYSLRIQKLTDNTIHTVSCNFRVKRTI